MTEAIIYHYHPVTGELLETESADYDPLENKVIVPAHSTLIKPSRVVKGKTPVFKETSGKWVNQEDNRGMVYNTTTGQEEQYAKLGALPSALTKLKPTPMQKWDVMTDAWVDDIVQHQAAKISHLGIDFVNSVQTYTTTNGILMDADETHIRRLKEACDLATLLSESSMDIIDNLNNIHPNVLLTDVTLMIKELQVNYRTLYFHYQNLRTSVNLASTISSVNSIVW